MSAPIALEDFDAALLDLDGVLAITGGVHAAAWKATFDEFLVSWGTRRGTQTPPFDDQSDYPEEYLVDAAAVDLADTAGNLRDGLHATFRP